MRIGAVRGLGPAVAIVAAGCGGDGGLGPVVGHWRADAAQPEVFSQSFRDFGNASEIDIGGDGKVTVGRGDATCSGTITRDEDAAGGVRFHVRLQDRCPFGLPPAFIVNATLATDDEPVRLTVWIPGGPNRRLYFFDRAS